MKKHGLTGIRLERTEEKLTAQSGLGIGFEEIYGALEVGKLIKAHMPKPGSNRGYGAETFIKPILATLLGGGESLEDIERINSDESLKKVIRIEKIPVSQAYGEWLRRIGSDKASFSGLGEAQKGIKHPIIKSTNLKEFTLDLDAVEIIADKKEAEWTYKNNKGYMPMLAFLKEVPVCIVEEFREGNDVPQNRNADIIRQSKSEMPEETTITRVRIDSAGYQAEVINECDNEDYPITFYIGASLDSAVQKAILSIPEKEWLPLKDKHGNDTDREVAETIHCMNKTKQSFRLVVQRFVPKKKKNTVDQVALFSAVEYRYRAIATNSTETCEEVVYFYNDRGQEENYNKEIKNGFSMRHMPCGQFEANAVWFRLGVMAYNLFIALKYLAFPPEWRQKTIKSMRWQLFQVAGKWVDHARQIVLKMGGVCQDIINLLKYVQQSCYMFRLSTA